jgi:putative tryptophan/tyrosine transport system substrate-binding protein
MPYRIVGLVVLVTLSMLMASRVSAAQQPKQVARVGILCPRLSRDAPFLQAFEQRLQALGYREGHNLAIECRTAGGQSERLPALAAELTQLPVDVIVVAAYENTLRAA